MWKKIAKRRPSLFRYLVSVYDLVLAGVSFYASYVVVYGIPEAFNVPGIAEKAASFVAITAICFYSFSVTRGSWRYVSIPEVLALIKASVVAVLVYTVSAFLVSRGSNVPRSVPVLTVMFLIASLSSSRLAYRLIMDGLGMQVFGRGRPRSATNRNVLVCGLTDEAEGFIRATQRLKNGQIYAVGIIDDYR